MDIKRKLLIALALAVLLPSAAWGLGFFRANTTGVAPEAMRAELGKELVKQWSPYV